MKMTEARLLEALDAWNTHDVDLILSYFAEDATYHASFGPEPRGRTYRGRAEVRQGIEQFKAAYPSGRFEETEVTITGDRGSAEWIFKTNGDREATVVRGCDLLEFDGDLISLKNAFRKSSSQ